MITRIAKIEEKAEEYNYLFEDLKDIAELFINMPTKGCKNDYIKQLDKTIQTLQVHKIYLKNTYVKGE